MSYKHRLTLIEEIIRYHLDFQDFTPRMLDAALARRTGKLAMYIKAENDRRQIPMGFTKEETEKK